MSSSAPRLSKSRFMAGYQCPKLLWWTVNEPMAPELQPDKVLQDLFDQGSLVGELARTVWPNGVLIEGDRRDAGRIPRTRAAIDAGAAVIFEACFEEGGAFCAVDVLERDGAGWRLIEVKSSSEVKDYHYPDLAVQAWIVRRAGLTVTRMEVMHLDKTYRLENGGSLFERSDVTAEVEKLIGDVPRQVAGMIAVLKADAVPGDAIGPHCWFRGSDKPCMFWDRCWPTERDHIRRLYRAGPTGAWKWMQKGVHWISDLPTERVGATLVVALKNDKQKRQVRAIREDKLIVEPGLREALRPAVEAKRLGYLDFETVMRAIPSWNGLGPWHQAAAQFSYHERQPNGTHTHAEFLAEGPADPSLPPDDPRERLARAMLEATKDADRVVVYTHFEGTRIKELAAHLPQLAEPLLALKEKLWDLNPVIEENVYHPDFAGSFSLKKVLTPLVPDLSYSDLIIVDGKLASVEIARLLFVSGRIPPAERDQTRRDLLEYCKRDTFATVRLVQRLTELG